MLQIERAEGEPQESFQRSACIESSLTGYPPYFTSLTYGKTHQSIEDQVFEGEERIQKYGFVPKKVEEGIQKRVGDLVLQNKLRALTNEQLETYDGQLHEELHQWGTTVLQRAHELGLSHTTSPTALVERLESGYEFESDIGLGQYAGYSSGRFESEGWEIYSTTDNAFLLVTAQPDTNPHEKVAVVNLDTLFIDDPQFLKDHIRNYHEVFGVHTMITKTFVHLAIHDAREADVISPAINILSADPKQVAKEKKAMRAFLSVGAIAKWNNQDPAFMFNRLSNESKALPNGRNTDVVDYVIHRMLCKGETEQTHERMSEINELYIKLRKLVSNPLIPKDLQPDEVALLHDPLEYTEERLQTIENEVSEIRQDYQSLAAVINATHNEKDPDIFLQTLAAEHPSQYSLFQSFQQWINEGGQGNDAFNRLIQQTATYLLYSASQEELTNKQVNDIRLVLK